MTRFKNLFLWGGGAIFTAVLALCAYLYLIVWGIPPATGNGRAAVLANALVFGVFALHHSLFARDWVKETVDRLVPRELNRSVYVWTASLLFLAVLALWQRVPGEIYAASGWRALAHGAVQVSGLWLIARSVARIDPLELAGIRPASRREGLQTAGPYRWVRHPVYLGWVLAVFGAAHMTADRLTFAVMTTTYVLVAIPWEERSLRRSYGESYARYQRSVRWRVLPYIY